MSRGPDGAQSRIDVVSVEPYKSILSCLRPYETDVYREALLMQEAVRKVASASVGLVPAEMAKNRSSLAGGRLINDHRTTTCFFRIFFRAVCHLHDSAACIVLPHRHLVTVPGTWQPARPPMNRCN